MSEVVIATLLIVCIAALSTGGLVLVRRKIGFAALIEHHEVANPMMSIVATFYSVLLGFLVVCAFNRFDSCRVLVQGEANSMSDVFHLAMGLHPGERLKIQNDCLNYVQSVIVDEFPAMSSGHASRLTRTKIDTIWNDLLTLSPKDELQGNVHQQMLTALMAASEHRRDRLFAMNVGMWPVLWGVLIFGNVTVIVFTYFFAMKHLKSQLIMVGMLSCMLSINIYLVIDFSCPFDGAITVSPEPLIQQRENFLEHFHERLPH